MFLDELSELNKEWGKWRGSKRNKNSRRNSSPRFPGGAQRVGGAWYVFLASPSPLLRPRSSLKANPVPAEEFLQPASVCVLCSQHLLLIKQCRSPTCCMRLWKLTVQTKTSTFIVQDQFKLEGSECVFADSQWYRLSQSSRHRPRKGSVIYPEKHLVYSKHCRWKIYATSGWALTDHLLEIKTGRNRTVPVLSVLAKYLAVNHRTQFFETHNVVTGSTSSVG